ncbi:MAG: hypothetical protein ACRCY8_05910, partial [Dermatophilaceae bacterium]
GLVWPSPVGVLRDTGERRGRRSAISVFEQVDDGRRWLFRRLDTFGRPMGTDGALREVAASRIFRRLGLPVPEVHVALLGDDTHPVEAGSLQEMIDGTDAWPDGFDPSAAETRDIGRLLKEQVVDWLVGNLDSHRDNFLRLPDGSLVGIDKEMAFGDLDDDLVWVLRTPVPQLRPDADYQRVYGALWAAAIRGELPVPDPASGPLGDAIRRVTAIDDDELRRLIRPYVTNTAERERVRREFHIDGVPISVVDAVIRRKHRLVDDFARLHAEAVARRALGTGAEGEGTEVPQQEAPGFRDPESSPELPGDDDSFGVAAEREDGEDPRLARDLATGFAVLGDWIGEGDHGVVYALAYQLDHPAQRDVPEELRVLKVPRSAPPPYFSASGQERWSAHGVGDFAVEVGHVRDALAQLPRLRSAHPRLVQWPGTDGDEQFGISMDLVDAPFCWAVFESAPDAPLPEVVGWEHVEQLRALEDEVRRADLRSCDFQGFYLPGGEFLLVDLMDASEVGADWEPTSLLAAQIADLADNLEARLRRWGRARD